MYLTDLMSQTGIKKDTFGSCCLTGVNMGHDADIAGQLEFFVCHFRFSCSVD